MFRLFQHESIRDWWHVSRADAKRPYPLHRPLRRSQPARRNVGHRHLHRYVGRHRRADRAGRNPGRDPGRDVLPRLAGITGVARQTGGGRSAGLDAARRGTWTSLNAACRRYQRPVSLRVSGPMRHLRPGPSPACCAGHVPAPRPGLAFLRSWITPLGSNETPTRAASLRPASQQCQRAVKLPSLSLIHRHATGSEVPSPFSSITLCHQPHHHTQPSISRRVSTPSTHVNSFVFAPACP